MVFTFDTHETFKLSYGSGFGKNIIKFGVGNSSSMHANNIKKSDICLVTISLVSFLSKSPM